MKSITTIKTPMEILNPPVIGNKINLDKSDYENRHQLLLERMEKESLTHVIVYADRERFSNVEYLTAYDPRFEEALFVVDIKGNLTLIVGNEGEGYAGIVPFPVNVVLYQNFSLQGQDRSKSKSLDEIFLDLGITANSSVGIIGYKYFVDENRNIVRNEYDIPYYIIKSVEKITSNYYNVTDIMTGLPDGLRMSLKTPKEVAIVSYMNDNVYRVFLNMFNSMEEGITELKLSEKAGGNFLPYNVHPMVNFGERSVSIGLKSPEDAALKIGDQMALCYSLRYSLVSRAGFMADSFDTLPENVKPMFDEYMKTYYSAVCTWYESIHVGAVAGKVYENVMNIIGDKKYGIFLNPGHNISSDEWTNSAFYENSVETLKSGSHMQCDIIASHSNPSILAICEDGVIIADQNFREEIKSEYPEIYAKFEKRQKFMRELLGINISDDVLPLSDINGVYFPYMMGKGTMYKKM